MKQLLLVTLLFLPACAPKSASPPSTALSQGESYRATIRSLGKIVSGDGRTDIEADIEFAYTWYGPPHEKTLKNDVLAIRGVMDGKVQTDTRMSREGVWRIIDGKAVPEDLTPEQLARMQEQFDTPICKLRFDEHGAETGREIIESKFAPRNRRDGAYENAILFHAPFYADRDKWQARRAVSIGNGAKAEGDLTYEKKSTDGDLATVRVSGELGAADAGTEGGVSRQNVRFVVEGEQVYDAGRKVWKHGTLTVDGSFELAEGGKVFGTSTAKMKMTLEHLPVPAVK